MNNGHPFDKRSARVSPLDSLKGRTGKGGKTKRDIEGFEREREREREREKGRKGRKEGRERRNIEAEWKEEVVELFIEGKVEAK